MFGARKKPDGFEWHKYIRTTIKLRREQRRQRVLDARRAAGQQINAAGVALAAGSRAAGVAARDGAKAGLGATLLGAQAVLAMLVYWLRVAMRPVIAFVSKPNIAGPLALAGAIALGAAFGRYRTSGLDRETFTTLVIGLLLMAALLPMLSQKMGWHMPTISPAVLRMGLIAAAVAVLAGGVAWFIKGGKVNVASLNPVSLISGAKPLEGRAQAIGGDSIRIAGKNVRLAGIEAPEPGQRCGKAGKEWRCGAAAEAALSRLVSGRGLTCALGGSGPDGRPLATCTSGKTDISAELVRRGHVFAQSGLFAKYSSQESEARSAKAGLWAGDAERPTAYRNKLWDEAKRRAPDGCPIKGQVSGGARVYVLPWSPDYERARVQKARGERWFCSEQEAVSAGFRAASRS
jgi:endonuclease YncB( thermonuclease family)